MITYIQYPATETSGSYFINTDTKEVFPEDPPIPGDGETESYPGNPQYNNMVRQVDEGEAVIEQAPPPPPLPDYIIQSQKDAEKTAPSALLAALQVVGVTIDPDTLSEAQIYSAIALWQDWALGVSYVAGDVAVYETLVYKCVQPNTSQVGWEPPNVPALWTLYNPPGVTVPWVQPTGAQDAYPLGQRVTHVGFTWQSTVDNNVWEPGVYGWSKV